MKLSIVTTLYYSEAWIEEFYERSRAAGSRLTRDFEIIMVNDGSPDNSLEKALDIQKYDSRVVVADLARNFGHHKAIRAGLCLAQGEFVFLIDSDLEEAPELLTLMWEKLCSQEDLDVVYGVQKKRKGRFFEKITGQVFYKILNFLLAEVPYPENPLTARIMSKDYVQALLSLEEREYDICYSFNFTGFKQLPIAVEKGFKGKSHYTLFKKIKMATETITSSSSRPLVLIFVLGLFISLISLFYILYLTIKKIFLNVLIGWTSILASIWLMGGLIMLSLGIIGIYVSKIFIESKNRPDFIIKKVYRQSK